MKGFQRRYTPGQEVGNFILINSLGAGIWAAKCNQCGRQYERSPHILAKHGYSFCNKTNRVSQYQPGQVVNGRILLKNLGAGKWRMRCESCNQEYTRFIARGKCRCQVKRVPPEVARDRRLKDHSHSLVRTFLIHPLEDLKPKKGGFLNWTGTCQKCGAIRSGPIRMFRDVGCSSCAQIEEQKLLTRKRANYQEGMNAKQRAAYMRYRRCHYSERETRVAALGVR